MEKLINAAEGLPIIDHIERFQVDLLHDTMSLSCREVESTSEIQSLMNVYEVLQAFDGHTFESRWS